MGRGDRRNSLKMRQRKAGMAAKRRAARPRSEIAAVHQAQAAATAQKRAAAAAAAAALANAKTAEQKPQEEE